MNRLLTLGKHPAWLMEQKGADTQVKGLLLTTQPV